MPVIQQPFSKRGLGLHLMLFHQLTKNPGPIGRLHTIEDDGVRVRMVPEVPFRVIDEGHSAGHSRTKIVAYGAKNDSDSVGHVLATIGAAPFDNNRGP